MPFYHKLGSIPHKRHTQHRRPDGQLYTEELFGFEGFSGCDSLLYHHHPPVRVVDLKPCGKDELEDWSDWLRRRAELLCDVEKLTNDRPVLWELWEVRMKAEG